MTNQPQNIFIVEDEVVVAFEMSDLLEDIGFNVVGPSIHPSGALKCARIVLRKTGARSPYANAG